jgi:hypothetical protein
LPESANVGAAADEVADDEALEAALDEDDDAGAAALEEAELDAAAELLGDDELAELPQAAKVAAAANTAAVVPNNFMFAPFRVVSPSDRPQIVTLYPVAAVAFWRRAFRVFR